MHCVDTIKSILMYELALSVIRYLYQMLVLVAHEIHTSSAPAAIADPRTL